MSISTGIETTLRGASAPFATELFIYAILVVFAIAVFQGFTRRHGRFLEIAPNLLTSLGILGTFVGIVIGLLDFDTANIDASISNLLEGLKTAFITSLAGMSASIAFKGLDAWKFAPMREETPSNEDVTAGHLLQALKTQNLHTLQLTRAIVGNEEGTLVGQLKLLRTDVTDFRTSHSRQQSEFELKLFEQMREFATMLARSATETVIEALRKVIADFNKNLVEQFGENFKALDQSVQKLVVWQQDYKAHIEALQQRIETTITAVERTAKATEEISASLGTASTSISTIGQSCERIPATMEELRSVLEVNQHQIGELQRHLQAFIEAREKAVQAVPEIKQRMDQLASELKLSVEGVGRTLHEGALEFGKSVDRTVGAVTEMAHQVTGGSEKIRQDLDDGSKQISKSLSDALARLGEATTKLPTQLQAVVKEFGDGVRDTVGTVLRDTTTQMRQSTESTLRESQSAVTEANSTMMRSVEAQVREAARRAEGAVNQQLDLINQALERELNEVFRAFGTALTSLSRRIADDHDAARRART